MFHAVLNHAVRHSVAQKRFAIYQMLYTRKTLSSSAKQPTSVPKKLMRLRNEFMKTNNPGRKPMRMPNKLSTPCWVEMIHDLVFGAGFSYSRIAYRIRVSPSTIQKLATDVHRKPRHYVFHALLCLHFKVFHGENVRPRALAYWNSKKAKK